MLASARLPGLGIGQLALAYVSERPHTALSVDGSWVLWRRAPHLSPPIKIIVFLVFMVL